MLKQLFTRKNIIPKQKIILVHKYLTELFEKDGRNSVDIPDFMKPRNERYAARAWHAIKSAIKNNEFDSLYRQALSAT